MKKELDKNSNLWYTVVTPIKKGNNKHAQTNPQRPLLVAVSPLRCVQLLPLLRHGGMGRGKPR